MKPVATDPYVEVEEDDIVVVKTKSAALEDDLGNVTSDRDKLVEVLHFCSIITCYIILQSSLAYKLQY